MKRPHLSKAVIRQLDAIPDRVLVAAVRTITIEDVAEYALLGLALNQGKITTSDPAPPPRSCGRWASRNLDGWQEKRKVLPKELRSIDSYAPSWNDSGFHLVSRTVEAWPIVYHPARLLTVSASVLEPLRDAAVVRFRVDQPLEKGTPNFEQDLAFSLKLLRESVGAARVYPADLSDADYARLQQVDWELLPPGSADLVLERLCSCKTAPERLVVAGERLRMLDRLGHDGFIIGSGRFAAYFGAKFGEKLVALENLEYGNALYVFEEDWERLSQLSRSELIRRRDPLVRRIPHVPGWQSALRQHLRTL